MEKYSKLIHWLPRIICLIAIAYISLFSMDAFNPEHSIWQQLGDFLMHLIPSFFLLAVLIVAWKWEMVGGVIFTILGLALTPYVFSINYNMNQSFWMSLGIIMTITFPFILVGILFIVGHWLNKKSM